jgi:hypothetical protein
MDKCRREKRHEEREGERERENQRKNKMVGGGKKEQKKIRYIEIDKCRGGKGTRRERKRERERERLKKKDTHYIS